MHLEQPFPLSYNVKIYLYSLRPPYQANPEKR